jgi:hypothetical protein
MADQERIDDKSYFGVQSGLGFAASANLQFPDIDIIPDPDGPIRAIDTTGEEYPTSTQHGIMESAITVNGKSIDFVGVRRMLDAMYGPVTPTTVGVTGKRRLWTPGTTKPAYFTTDYGGTRFQRAIDCFLHKLHFHADLNSTVFDGAGRGQMILDSGLDGLTLASSPTLLAQKTPDPLRAGLAVATSLSGLDSASWYNNGQVFDFNVDGRWGTKHAMNPDLAGTYNGVVRKKPSAADGMIQLGADDDGWAWLSHVKNNAIRYLRWAIYGDEIAAGTAEVQTVDLSGDDDPTGGTWSMTIRGKTLAGLAWNISAAALQALINNLVGYGFAAITVSKTGFVYTITFPEYLGNVAAITADATGLTGGVGDTFAITVLTTTPGVAPVTYYFGIDMAVSPRGWPKRSEVEGLDTLDIDLWLMKTATLNGYQFVLVNEDAT